MTAVAPDVLIPAQSTLWLALSQHRGGQHDEWIRYPCAGHPNRAPRSRRDDPRCRQHVARIVFATAALARPGGDAASRPVKFDYLVAQRFITREQLTAALAEAKEQPQSVESIL